MKRNGTQKARSVTRIVTTIKQKKKRNKEVSFKNKREEREICINSEESHFYLQMCRKIFHQEKSSTHAHLVSIARKSRTYYGSMPARNISQQCAKPWRIVWEKELKGILCCVWLPDPVLGQGGRPNIQQVHMVPLQHKSTKISKAELWECSKCCTTL